MIHCTDLPSGGFLGLLFAPENGTTMPVCATGGDGEGYVVDTTMAKEPVNAFNELLVDSDCLESREDRP